jgi:mRNA interferase HigB
MQLRAWYDEVRKARWKTFNELKADFPKASLAGNNRVVFNICGGSFRLIVKTEWHMDAVFVRFFGTHAEYDRINAGEV